MRKQIRRANEIREDEELKPGTISSVVFAIACTGAAFLSARILGPGMWGWIMLGGGLFVAASAHIPILAVPGRTVGMLAGVLGLLAVGLGLLAATIGGGFKLPGDQGLLLATIFVIAVSGILYSRSKPRAKDND